jgi:hypothetical protein
MTGLGASRQGAQEAARARLGRRVLLDLASAKVDETDALFMIGACAAFVSYLINKSRAAGLLRKVWPLAASRRLAYEPRLGMAFAAAKSMHASKKPMAM